MNQNLRASLTMGSLLGFFLVATAPSLATHDDLEGQDLAGSVTLAGSTTVTPLSEEVAAAFRQVQSGVDLDIQPTGSGDGLRQLAAGEVDIAQASRPIRDDERTAVGAEAFVEVPVALDGVAIIVPGENDWAIDLTFAELRGIWSGDVSSWSEVRDGWPEVPIARHANEPGSGTVQFVSETLGVESLADDTQRHLDAASQLSAVAGDRGAIGQISHGVARMHPEVRGLAVDSGFGPVEPSAESLADASYPIGRVLWLYVLVAALERGEVAAFVDFYLAHVVQLGESEDVRSGFVQLPVSVRERAWERLRGKIPGTVFGQSLEGVAEEYGEPPS